MKITNKFSKKFNLIIKHKNDEYDYCTEGYHIHHCTVAVNTSDEKNVGKFKEIQNSLNSIDCIVESEELTIQQTIEKFFNFCNNLLLVDNIQLSFEHDYEVLFKIKREHT